MKAAILITSILLTVSTVPALVPQRTKVPSPKSTQILKRKR